MVVPEAYQKPSQLRPLPLAGQLLAYAATGASFGTAWCNEAADPESFRWVVDGGLGALLHHACAPALECVPPAWRGTLQSAHLTAHFLNASRVETTLEILDACDAAQVRAVLLKGISVSEQIYPAEHLRPMSDVDVLLPSEARAAVEDALLRRGYMRLEWPDDPGHHHGAPLWHPRRGVVVELHTALFPAGSLLSEGQVFRPARLQEKAVDSLYHGRPVRRLTPELQLAYTASSWFKDLATFGRPHSTFLASAFDAAYMLKAWGPTIDWAGLLTELDNAWGKASLYLALSYLPRYGIAEPPPGVLAQLASAQTLVGPIQRRLIHHMLDRQLFGGQPWRYPLPPPYPGRYSVRHQFRKRILDRLLGRRPTALG